MWPHWTTLWFQVSWCEVADWLPLNGSDHTSIHAELKIGEVPGP